MRFVIAIIIVLNLFSCDYIDYAEGIQHETKVQFEFTKAFIRNLAFTGKIHEKKYCFDCKINKYEIKILVFELSEKPSLNSYMFPPFYSFDADSFLNISISKNMFENILVGDTIIKQKNGLSINIENIEYKYLSADSTKWLN
jgi:hypothetical protein